jgi:alkanesulfonate monooxygenase SsuD/methylene tetrahydromethanopterin reductase-like flavin-dependent oxidoreductase (luciferase family)
MAKGRFMWGIGSGALPADGAMFNIDFFKLEQRKAAREVLDAVLDLWNDPKPGVYETDYFRYEVPEEVPSTSQKLHLRPYTSPHPPLAVAGVGPKSDMLTLAGQHGWIPLSLNFITPHTIRSQWETYAENAAANDILADRRIWRVTREIAVGRTSKEARKLAIEGTIGRDWGTYIIPLLKRLGQTIALKVDPEMPDDEITVEYCADNLWVVGDVDEVTEKLTNLYDYTGGYGVLLAMMHEWDGDGAWQESMRLLAEEVRPNMPSPDAPVAAAAAGQSS